jgi:hypothetical protein
MAGLISRFVENFGKVPEPRESRIPPAWRIPVFAGIAALSLVLLALLLHFVVMPGIRAESPPAAPVPAATN